MEGHECGSADIHDIEGWYGVAVWIGSTGLADSRKLEVSPRLKCWSLRSRAS